MAAFDDEKDDIVAEAQRLNERDRSAWSMNYMKAREDLEFLSDERGCQWESKQFEDRIRSGRPALQIDQLSQFVHQVVNDIRQNTPSINAIPSGTTTDVATAEMVEGLIRQIEYKSRADEVYDTAANNSVRCSIGFIRVDTCYSDDVGSEQELEIKRVINPLAVWIDSDSTEADGRDMRHAVVLEDVTVAEFKRRWPKFTPSDFSSKKERQYQNSDTITVAEFFQLEEEEKSIAYTESGDMIEDDGDDHPVKRKITKRKIMRYWLSGSDVLEKSSFPGDYVPIVPVYGEEAWIDGRRHIFSLIRKSKDAQMMFNLWASLETELLLKQPQAPVMVAAGTIEAYADDWKNPSKAMALRYDHIDKDGNPAPAPQRLDPPTIPTGIVNAKRETLDDLKATLGMYNASIGERSNETSGVAISNRQKEGDVATYHFVDNLNRSIAQCGRIIVGAIPEIYDTARIIQIIGNDDEPDQVGINGAMVPNQEQPFDLSNLKLTVRVTTGASYTTKRQETVAALNQLFQSQPELVSIMGDIYFTNSDFAGAPAMADRMKKVIEAKSPGLIDQPGQEQDPQKIQMQHAIQQMQVQLQQTQQALAQCEQELKSKQGESAVKAQDTQVRAQVDMASVQQKQSQAEMDFQIKQAQLAIDQEELAIKKVQLQIEIMQAQQMGAQSPNEDTAPVEAENPDDVEVLQAKMQQATSRRQQQNDQVSAQQQSQQYQQAKDAAYLQGIQGIEAMLAQLTQAVTQPKQVVYAPDGKIIGVQ